MEGNSIHYEQEAAEQAGFRAPLIGGGMGVHYLTAEMWRRYQPRPSVPIYLPDARYSGTNQLQSGCPGGSESH